MVTWESCEGVVYRHGSTGLREVAVLRSGEEIDGRHVNHPQLDRYNAPGRSM